MQQYRGQYKARNAYVGQLIALGVVRSRSPVCSDVLATSRRGERIGIAGLKLLLYAVRISIMLAPSHRVQIVDSDQFSAESRARLFETADRS